MPLLRDSRAVSPLSNSLVDSTKGIEESRDILFAVQAAPSAPPSEFSYFLSKSESSYFSSKSEFSYFLSKSEFSYFLVPVSAGPDGFVTNRHCPVTNLSPIRQNANAAPSRAPKRTHCNTVVFHFGAREGAALGF